MLISGSGWFLRIKAKRQKGIKIPSKLAPCIRSFNKGINVVLNKTNNFILLS